MNAEQLKNSILQRAIEGKLVEQREEEGAAAELLREIRAEKARLVKEGKLKKEKPLPEIKAEEKPFEIPESWEWVRLGDLGVVVGGGTPKTHQAEYWDGTIPWLTPADMKNIHGMYASRGSRNISELGLNKSSARLMPKGTILYSSRAPIGYIAIAQNSITTNQGFKSLVPFIQEINLYMYYCLIACTSEIQSRASGTTFKEISGTEFGRTIIPLPPLSEQKRIVAKIEELLPHVEQYGKAHDELTALNEKFPDAMKKSVLQYAMEGKLVEQRDEEGTAKELLAAIKAEKARLVKEGKLKKEKPLPEIKAEEIPFEIPESWEWVRIGDIFTTSSGTTPSKSNPAYYHNAKYNWVRTTDLNNGVLQSCEIKISSLAKAECNLEILPRKSVCIAMYGGAGTIGKNAIIEFDTTINQSVFAIHPNGHCEMKYILYFIQFYRNKWMDFAAGSRKDPNINGNIIKMTILPLPPLAEQKRIVAKIEELLACCGRLGES